MMYLTEVLVDLFIVHHPHKILYSQKQGYSLTMPGIS